MSSLHSLAKHLSLFKLSGNDAAVFLQNQTINLFDDQWPQPHYTAICNPKGRILFSLLVWKQFDDYYLAVDKTLSEQFEQYIQMRIFRMGVKLKVADERQPVVEATDYRRVEDIQLTLTADLTVADETLFWALFFRAELPWITRQTSEQFIPQHLSLDQHQLIEYQKGCYPGQEIIARLHFIGRNKKHLTLVQLDKNHTDLKNAEKVTINDSPVQLCSPPINFNGQLCAQIVKNKSGADD